MCCENCPKCKDCGKLHKNCKCQKNKEEYYNRLIQAGIKESLENPTTI